MRPTSIQVCAFDYFAFGAEGTPTGPVVNDVGVDYCGYEN